MTQLLKTLPPGVKPTYPVEIDWSHPFARGLVLAVDCATGFDLVRGKYMSAPNGLVRSVNTAGTVGDFNGTNDYINVPSDNIFDFIGVASLMLAGLSYTGTSNNVVCEKGSNNGFAVQTDTDGTLKATTYGLGGGQNTNTAWNDGRPHNFVMINQGSQNEYFVDGAPDGSSAETNSAENGSDFNIGSRAGSFVFDGSLAYVFAWTGTSSPGISLTSSAAQSLSADPYQFLQPAGHTPRAQIITTTPTAKTFEYTVPDPKWEAPAIMAGMKPTGPVVVDKTHRHASGLKHFYLGGPGLHITDVLTGNNYSAIPYASATPTVDTVAGLGHTPKLDNEAEAIALETVGPMSTGAILAHYRADWTGTNDSVFAHSDYLSGNRLYFGLSSGYIMYRLGSGAYTNYTGVTYSSGDIITAGMTWANGTARIFVGGKFVTTYSYSGTPGSDSEYSCYGYYHSNELLGYSLQSTLGSIVIWSKQIPDAQMECALRDPYACLIPA